MPSDLSLGPVIIGKAASKGKAEDRGVRAVLVIAWPRPTATAPRDAIERERRLVAVLDFEKQLLGAELRARRPIAVLKQGAAEPRAAAGRRDAEGQELCLVGGLPRDQQTCR